MRVEFSTREDARRVVYETLDGGAGGMLSPRVMNRLGDVLLGKLMDSGLLAQSVEQHYSAAQVARLLNRTQEWAANRARIGDFGRVSRDAGGWLIPASGVQGYLDRNGIG